MWLQQTSPHSVPFHRRIMDTITRPVSQGLGSILGTASSIMLEKGPASGILETPWYSEEQKIWLWTMLTGFN